jgi:hypothetical protein
MHQVPPKWHTQRHIVCQVPARSRAMCHWHTRPGNRCADRSAVRDAGLVGGISLDVYAGPGNPNSREPADGRGCVRPGV